MPLRNTGCYKKASTFKVELDDVSVLPSGHIKFLGIILDQHLTMEKHTASVVKRCFGILITLKKLSLTLPKSTLTTLVRALAFPHITYCLPAWAPATMALRQRVDKVINFAARVVTKKRKYDHISDSKEQLGFPLFENILKERDCTLIHRLINRQDAPENLKSLVEYRADVSERETRETLSSALHAPRCRLEATRRSVPVRPIQAWNSLPVDLRRVVNARRFKKALKAVLVSPS